MIDTKALRQKILDLAIRGLLVPQDPNDEPASVLLEKIRAEKQRLIKEGKIKKDKNDSVIYRGDDNRYYEKIGNFEPKCIDNDLPFNIPDSWRWVRLGDLVTVISGVSYDKKDVCDAGIRILRSGNIANLHVTTLSEDIFLPIKYFDKEKQVKENDILIVASTGSKTVIGKAGFINEELGNTQIGAFLRIIRSIYEEFVPYLKVIFSSRFYMEYISKKANGTNINNIKTEYITEFIIPIPPLNEQQRIVDCSKELFTQIVIIENNQTELDQLYDDLKKKTLALAIQGKIVPQDPNDEPASVLLERIRAEKKAKLGKKYVDSYIYKGDDNCYYEKIGDNKPVLLENLPFEIPESWAWERLGTLISLLSGRDLQPNQYNDHNIGIPYITGASNFIEGNLVLNRWTNKPLTVSKLGDLLLTCKGTIGTMAVNNVGDIHIARQVMAISTQYLHIAYIKLFLESYVQQLQAKAKSFIPGIGRDDLNFALIPIPPLSEQGRITNANSTFLSIVDKGEI